MNQGGKVPSLSTRRSVLRGPLCDSFFVMLSDRVAALSNTNRLKILEWLKHPARHFGPTHPVDQKKGVCGLYIAEKLGVTPATASTHLKVLTSAGFIRPLRVGKYTYFKRVDAALADFARDIADI